MYLQAVHAHINGYDYWPVNFHSFHAAALPGGDVHLRRRTVNEVANAGFTVQMRGEPEDERWRDVAFVASRAPEGQGAGYEYTDRGVAARSGGGTVQYRLCQHDYDGSVSYSDVQTVALAGLAGTLSLTVWPYPADRHVSMHADMRKGESAVLYIGDLLGREVRRFERIAAGDVITWDRTGADGRPLPPGLYRVLQRNNAVSAMSVSRSRG